MPCLAERYQQQTKPKNHILDLENAADRIESLIKQFDSALRVHHLRECEQLTARIENEVRHIKKIIKSQQMGVNYVN